MWAHWRHLANMTELLLSSVHPSTQPKRQIDRFSRFCMHSSRQSVVGYIGATWRIRLKLATTIELVLPSAHPSPQPKRQIDRYSRFCTVHGRLSIYLNNGRPFPQNFPNLNHDSLGESHRTVQTAQRSAQPFLHSDRRVSLYFTMDRPFPQKLSLPMRDREPHFKHDSLGHPSLHPKRNFDRSAVLRR